ncbi:hypothetical protein NW762_013116 [Fusarium torreyae]|uniref:Chitin-binding type-1 domain-containing protein n=1 Tax=Fusarium torreyae TaxID=1237075 RepID=A0A9W8RMK3_9HYPO|nr:hypothetical protein NW762_013116 [Fusarium torreyae]
MDTSQTPIYSSQNLWMPMLSQIKSLQKSLSGRNATCVGTDYGPYCSGGGWCGDSDAHCGADCQSGCDGNDDGNDDGGDDDGFIDLKKKGTQAGKSGDNGKDWPEDVIDDI